MNADFPDLLACVIGYLETATGVRATADVPEDLTSPVLVVEEVGGADDDITDSASFDVSSFAPTYDVARANASRARQAVRAIGGTGTPLLDSGETVTRPTRRDYENPDVERIIGTYRVTARRPVPLD